ncbi:MAG TPA: hypothetical protein VL916_00835 [Ilumatobacteraceae bacterium]|nr:hypothetical protein [Ilumatobacteraceae bacterium]
MRGPVRRDLIVLAGACVLLRLPALLASRWYDPDEAAIAMQARTLVAGGELYTDMADRKPPVPPIAYSWFFDLTDSSDPRPARLLVSLLLAGAAIALYLDVRRSAGTTVARWAGGLFVLGAFAFPPTDGGAANYAHFALPVATLALLACRRTRVGRGMWWALAGGGLLGFAMLNRQSWVFAVPAGALSCWLGARWRALPLFGIGVAAAVSTAALMAPWDEYWFWNFKSSPGFVFAATDLGEAAGRAVATAALFVVLHLALVVGAGSTLPGSLRRQPDLWAWVVMGLAATSAGLRFYGHYWMQLLPGLVLLAAPAIAAASQRWRRIAAGTLAAAAVFAFAGLVIPDTFRERHDPDDVAAEVQACTAPGDRVFVWGSFPELSIAVERPAAGELVHSDFVTGRSGGRQASTDAVTPGAEDKMMDDLDADPPVVLIDTSGVPDLLYEAFPMLDNERLADFVTGHEYRSTTTPEGFELWWRADSPCAPGASADGQ